MEDGHKSSTRIFKKSTPNGKITIYLGKRDFIDHLTHVDPIEGVVLIDPDYVKGRKVFIQLLGSFWYGRDELDILGLSYYQDFSLLTRQIYPIIGPELSYDPFSGTTSKDHREVKELTRLQERLMRKLGANARPFCFQLRPYLPASVSLLLHPSDHSKRCRIDYELKVYVADDPDEKPQKRNSVRMAIRKLTFAPDEPGQQPSVELSRDFLMSVGSLRVEATLDKHKYFHGETVSVNLLVDNNSNKTIKRIKIAVRQYTQVTYHSLVNYKCTVAEVQSEEGCPISPSQTGWCKVYRLCPLLINNRDKFGVSMDGDLKQEDTNLASSTMVSDDESNHNNVGIVVQYKVKVRLVLGFGISDVCVELPFVLTHSNGSSNDTDKDLSVDQTTTVTTKKRTNNNNDKEEEEETHCNSGVSHKIWSGTTNTTNMSAITHISGNNYKDCGYVSLINTYPENGRSMQTQAQINQNLLHFDHYQSDIDIMNQQHIQQPVHSPKGVNNCLITLHNDNHDHSFNHHNNNNDKNVTNVNSHGFDSLHDTLFRMSSSNDSSMLNNNKSDPNDSIPAWHRNSGLSYPTILTATNNRHPSTSGTEVTVHDDDLLFEDFARFRLQSNLNRSGAMPS